MAPGIIRSSTSFLSEFSLRIFSTSFSSEFSLGTFSYITAALKEKLQPLSFLTTLRSRRCSCTGKCPKDVLVLSEHLSALRTGSLVLLLCLIVVIPLKGLYPHNPTRHAKAMPTTRDRVWHAFQAYRAVEKSEYAVFLFGHLR
jgi:hypothetical protein